MTRSEFIQRMYIVTANLDRALTLTKKLEESGEAPFDDELPEELEELLAAVDRALAEGLPEETFARLRDARNAFELETEDDDEDTEDDG